MLSNSVLSTLVVALAALPQLSSGHGWVQQILFGSNDLVDTWNPYKDPQKVPAVQKITRKFPDNGPVTDGLFTSKTITCNYGLDSESDPSYAKPVAYTHSVAAGSSATFYWTEWASDHPGPIMTYLAACPGSCSSFDGTSGNIWFKIHQEGYDASYAVPWASKRLYTQNSTWTVMLPTNIKNGEYILRHEILGLQRAASTGLSQFYPNCHQITITGGGSIDLTSASGGIALPGAYPLDDPGIFLEYRDISASNPYTPPGGPVRTELGIPSRPSNTVAPSGGGATATSTSSTKTSSSSTRTSSSSTRTSSSSTRTSSSSTRTSSSSTRTTSSSSSSRTSSTLRTSTTTAASSSGSVAAYGQCGGSGWTGGTACVSGYTCTYSNDFYSQCLPS